MMTHDIAANHQNILFLQPLLPTCHRTYTDSSMNIWQANDVYIFDIHSIEVSVYLIKYLLFFNDGVRLCISGIGPLSIPQMVYE